MWNSIPSLQSLKLFDSVVRHRSMTRAAAAAGVSQSAVSQSIRQLEDFVQTPLLDRSSRPMSLTEEGENLHRTSMEALTRLAHTVEDLRRIGDRVSDAVTISCNLGFATYWLMPRLNLFSADFPDVAINVMAAYQGDAGFESGADIAIRYGNGKWPDENWKLLFRETLAPICSPEYSKRSGPIRTPAELSDQRLIRVTATDPNWPGWEEYFKLVGHDRPPSAGGLRFGNYVQAVQAALTAEGIMLGWRSVVGDLLKSQQLTIAFGQPVQLSNGFYFKASRAYQEGHRVSIFLDWLEQQALHTPDF